MLGYAQSPSEHLIKQFVQYVGSKISYCTNKCIAISLKQHFILCVWTWTRWSGAFHTLVAHAHCPIPISYCPMYTDSFWKIGRHFFCGFRNFVYACLIHLVQIRWDKARFCFSQRFQESEYFYVNFLRWFYETGLDIRSSVHVLWSSSDFVGWYVVWCSFAYWDMQNCPKIIFESRSRLMSHAESLNTVSSFIFDGNEWRLWYHDSTELSSFSLSVTDFLGSFVRDNFLKSVPMSGF